MPACVVIGAQGGAAVDGLHDARGEGRDAQLHEAQHGVGRERRRLHDHAVARDQGARHLQRGQDHGEVPRADGAHDAQGLVRRHDLDVLVLVLDVILQGGVCDVQDLSARVADFDLAHQPRLARLPHGELCDLRGVVVDDVDHLPERRLALRDCRLAPCLEGLVGRDDGLLEVLGGGYGGVPERLLRPRVSDLVPFGSGALLAVDDVVELVGLVFLDASHLEMGYRERKTRCCADVS